VTTLRCTSVKNRAIDGTTSTAATAAAKTNEHCRERRARRGAGVDGEHLREQVGVVSDAPAPDDGDDGADREGPGAAVCAAAEHDEHAGAAQQRHDHERQAVVDVARPGVQRDDPGDRERAGHDGGHQGAGDEVQLEIETERRSCQEMGIRP
jgi:hypothetical protein